MRVTIIKPTVNQQKKKKVCAYARASTDSLSQGESLENQIQYYENIISNNPEYEFIGVFVDIGITFYYKRLQLNNEQLIEENKFY